MTSDDKDFTDKIDAWCTKYGIKNTFYEMSKEEICSCPELKTDFLIDQFLLEVCGIDRKKEIEKYNKKVKND